jgi:hypothetical protein
MDYRDFRSPKARHRESFLDAKLILETMPQKLATRILPYCTGTFRMYRRGFQPRSRNGVNLLQLIRLLNPQR